MALGSHHQLRPAQGRERAAVVAYFRLLTSEVGRTHPHRPQAAMFVKGRGPKAGGGLGPGAGRPTAESIVAYGGPRAALARDRFASGGQMQLLRGEEEALLQDGGGRGEKVLW